MIKCKYCRQDDLEFPTAYLAVCALEKEEIDLWNDRDLIEAPIETAIEDGTFKPIYDKLYYLYFTQHFINVKILKGVDIRPQHFVLEKWERCNDKT